MVEIMERLIREVFSRQSSSRVIEIISNNLGWIHVNELINRYYWKVQSKRWHFHGPPIRPSSEDIGTYSFFLEEKSDAQNILILGATPELRGILARKFPSHVITVVDFSPEMYCATTKELDVAKNLSEKWINSNWLTLSVPNQSFDIVIGDRVLEQCFSQKDERSFFSEIKRVLRPTGIFISRFRLRNDQFGGLPIKKIITNLLKEDQQPQKGIPLALAWRIRDAYTDTKERVIDYASIKHILKEYIQEKNSVPVFVTTFDNVLRDITAFPFRWTHASPSDKELEALYFPFFTPVQKRYSMDYFDSRQYPIFIFKPNYS